MIDLAAELAKMSSTERHVLRSTYGAVPSVIWQEEPCPLGKPSDVEPAACSDCGRDLALHRERVATREDEKVWLWLVDHGGIPDLSSGYQDELSDIVRRHLTECDVLVERCKGPWFRPVGAPTWDETTGLDEQITVIGHLSCVCGDIRRLLWALAEDVTPAEVRFNALTYRGTERRPRL